MHRYLLCIILACSVLFANIENPNLRIADFRIPSSKTHGLFLSIGLDKSSYGDRVSSHFYISPYFRILSDTTEVDLALWIDGGRLASYWHFGSHGFSDIRNYPLQSPFFLHGNLQFRSAVFEPRWEHQISFDVEVGGGFGHLREGKYVALAMHINEILLEDEIIGRNLASETILQLARILSQERFFAMRYDRHLKHFYGEIESVLESDAACNMPVPAFTWFKIYEILQATRHYSWSQEYRFWRRLFGSRLNLDFVANDIREDIIIYRYRRMQFPIIPSCYYTPGIRLKYEYGNPIDLRRQMTFVSSYMVKWFDTVVLHEVDIQGRYGYGIIDFLVLEGIASLFYDGVFEGDNSSYSTFGFRPEVDFRYYIENNIYVELNGGCDFRRERTMSPEIHYDYIASWFIEFRTRWRIF